MEDKLTNHDDSFRDPTLLESLTPIISVVLLLGIGFGVLGLRIELLLILAATITGFIAWRQGMTWNQMQDGIVDSTAKAMPAILIVITVGALIASWIASGTIPLIVHYGLQIISPAWFLVTACVLCSIVSLVIGTSWGTIGTVGIALLGIAEGLGIPLAPAAGAVVAGAYFGDKLSPFSDTTNLAPIAARANLYDHIGHMLWTTMPAWIIGLLVYTLVGHGGEPMGEFRAAGDLSDAIEAHFNLSFILLLPALITLGAAVLKKPVIPGMLLSIAVAFVLAIVMQDLGNEVIGEPGTFNKDHLTSVRISAGFVLGYTPDTGNTGLDRIVSRGGMQSMMGTALIAFCAFGFAGIATRARMLSVLLRELSRYAKTTGQLIAATVGSCLTVAGITGNSYLSILVPGELFRGAYRERGLAAKNLSRTTEDSGTVVVPLIPWSISAVFIFETLGVPATQYAPWAVMCYLGFVFSLIWGFTGIGIAPKVNDDETQPGS